MIYLNSVLLFSSGLYASYLHLLAGSMSIVNLVYLEVLIISFSLMFMCVQIVEYVSNIFTINLTVGTTVFFTLTGLHGSHVLIGAAYLLLTQDSTLIVVNNVGFVSALIYWHFVDTIWILLLTTLYELEWSICLCICLLYTSPSPRD